MVYGMTEIGGTATTTNPYEKHSLSIGKPNSNMHLKASFSPITCFVKIWFFQVIDEEGNALDSNETGEILLKTDHKFLGYLGNEEANREFIDDEGWIHTGDLGYYDDKFNFYIIDRKKDTLKYFGYQISPSEIEAIIEKIYGVEMVCVIGIPDLLLNDLVTAVVVKSANSDLREEDVLYECNGKFKLKFKNLTFV